MSSLLQKYEDSNAPNVTDAKKQSEGRIGVNHFDEQSKYQAEFTPRTPGDTTVQLDSTDDSTNGHFSETSLSFYQEQVSRLAGMFHKHNQRDKKTHYIEQNKTTLGIANQSTPS
jgi:hypothetical protein